MLLNGSCQCKTIQYELETDLYYPYMICYCSICRKTNGAPFGVNIKGALGDLKIISGKDDLKIYNAKDCDRHFCSKCGSPLYITDHRWPDDVWPNAASIDTPLPRPPEYQQIFLDDKVGWFNPEMSGEQFKGYPEWSIEEFHQHWELLPNK